MQSFSFLLVKLETVEDLSVAINGLKLVAVLTIIAQIEFLLLLYFIKIYDFSQLLQSILHSQGDFILLFETRRLFVL